MIMTPLRRRTAAMAAALLSVSLVLTACGGSGGDSAGAGGQTRKVEADNGTVEVPADPQRVAVLGNAVLPYLDLGGKPVGVTDVSSSALADLPPDQQAAFKAATNLGTTGGQADYEKLATLEPDLIVIAVPDSDYAKLAEKLTSIAPTVQLGFESDWKFRATALAEASNEMDAFNEQKADYDGLVATIRQKYGEALKSATVVETYRTAATEPGQFDINNSLCAEAVRDEGIVGFAPGATLSFEQISSLAEDDLILYSAGIDGRPSEAWLPCWRPTPGRRFRRCRPVTRKDLLPVGQVLRLHGAIPGGPGASSGDAAEGRVTALRPLAMTPLSRRGVSCPGNVDQTITTMVRYLCALASLPVGE